MRYRPFAINRLAESIYDSSEHPGPDATKRLRLLETNKASRFDPFEIVNRHEINQLAIEADNFGFDGLANAAGFDNALGTDLGGDAGSLNGEPDNSSHTAEAFNLGVKSPRSESFELALKFAFGTHDSCSLLGASSL